MSSNRKIKNGASCRIMLIRIDQTSTEQHTFLAVWQQLGFFSFTRNLLFLLLVGLAVNTIVNWSKLHDQIARMMMHNTRLLATLSSCEINYRVHAISVRKEKSIVSPWKSRRIRWCRPPCRCKLTAIETVDLWWGHLWVITIDQWWEWASEAVG